jgi:HK97 gp10 family phage protein
MELKITGVKEIDRALATFERVTARKIIRSSMREALKLMQARAKELAPRGVSRMLRGVQHAAGTLMRNIKIRAAKVRRRGEIAISVRIGAGDFKGEQFYGSFPEYGTKEQHAQHFLLRAFRATRDQVRDRTNELIRAKINETLGWWHKI